MNVRKTASERMTGGVSRCWCLPVPPVCLLCASCVPPVCLLCASCVPCISLVAQTHPAAFPASSFASLGLAVGCIGDNLVAGGSRVGSGLGGGGTVLLWRRNDAVAVWTFAQALFPALTTPTSSLAFFGSSLKGAWAWSWEWSLSPDSVPVSDGLLVVGAPLFATSFAAWPYATGEPSALAAGGFGEVWTETLLSLPPGGASSQPQPGTRGHPWAVLGGYTGSGPAVATALGCSLSGVTSDTHVFGGGGPRWVLLPPVDMPLGAVLILTLALCPGVAPGAVALDVQVRGGGLDSASTTPTAAGLSAVDTSALPLLYTLPAANLTAGFAEVKVTLPAQGTAEVVLGLWLAAGALPLAINQFTLLRTGYPKFDSVLTRVAVLPASGLVDAYPTAIAATHGSAVSVAYSTSGGEAVIVMGGATLFSDTSGVQTVVQAWGLSPGAHIPSGPSLSTPVAGNVDSHRAQYSLSLTQGTVAVGASFTTSDTAPDGTAASGSVTLVQPSLSEAGVDLVPSNLITPLVTTTR